MTKFTSEFQRKAAAIVAAFVLSTTFVGAAVGPAHAVSAAPVTAAATVSGQASA